MLLIVVLSFWFAIWNPWWFSQYAMFKQFTIQRILKYRQIALTFQKFKKRSGRTVLLFVLIFLLYFLFLQILTLLRWKYITNRKCQELKFQVKIMNHLSFVPQEPYSNWYQKSKNICRQFCTDANFNEI